MKFRTQLLQIGVVGLVGALAIGLTSWYSQHAYSHALDVAARNESALRNHLEGDMMHDALRSDVQRALWVANEKNTAEYPDVKQSVKAHGNNFRERVQENKKLELGQEARHVLEQIETLLNAYILLAEGHVDLALTDLAAERKQLSVFETAYLELENKMEAASDKLQTVAEEDTVAVKTKVYIASWIQTLVILISGIASLGLAWRVAGNVMSELGGEPADAVNAAKRLGGGDYTSNAILGSAPKLSLLGQLESMRAQLHANANIAIENARVKQALDATSSNIMLADTGRNIVYMN